MSSQELEFEEQIERVRRKKGKERKEEKKSTKEALVESKTKIEIELGKEGYSALVKGKEILDFERIEIEEIKAPLPVFSFEKTYKSHLSFKKFLESFLEIDIKPFTKAIPKFNVFEAHKSLIKAAENIVEFDIKGEESKLYRIGIPIVQFTSYKPGIKSEQAEKKPTIAKISGEEEIRELEEGVLDILFEPISEEHDLKGILHASSERPVIILAEKSEDDYIDALKLILREVYRIKVGGFPEAIVTKKEKKEVEEVKAERRIHVIDDSEDKFFDFFKINKEKELKIGLDKILEAKARDLEKVDMDKLLEERLEELFSQGFGFLVFYLKKENFDFLCNSFGIKEHKIPKLILIKGRELKEDEIYKISSASWGFLEPWGLWRSLSDYFSGYEKEFHNKLEKLSEMKYTIYVRESAEDEEGGKESNLHYLLKIFLVKYLKEKLKIEEDIEIETKRNEVIPDIFIPSENLAIEVETLYGTGIATLRKLGKTIEKYEGKGYKLWVIMPNLQLLLFYRDVKEIIKTFKDKVELEFFGVDLSKQELVHFDKFKDELSLLKWN